jgi:phosphopantothenoylcysteine decarboxylase/phosphopantothenate--cysteine ligase
MSKLSSRKSAFKALSVLVTSGPTSVPIDAMRVITNRSTGEMGRLLATGWARHGARVTLLEGAVTTSLALPSGITVKKFFFLNDLSVLLDRELDDHYDIIFHAAAVSDFILPKPSASKLPSHKSMTLRLIPGPKLIDRIKARQPAVTLIGFKFEQNITRPATLNKAKDLFRRAGCTMVVLNENSASGYNALILSSNGTISRTLTSRRKLVNELINMLQNENP